MTSRARIAVVIPVLDQLEVTLECLARLRCPGIAPPDQIIVVDNGSSSGTASALRDLTGITLLRNTDNRGCAAAWNQGVATSNAEWTVLLNNDVLVTPGWTAGLLEIALATGATVVSPAIREGPVNYNLDAYACDFTRALRGVVRLGVADGIAFMVHRSTFDSIGTFDEGFRVGQFEDADFFRRARQAGLKLATGGAAFVHHYGSLTQRALRAAPGARDYAGANRAYYLRKWKLTWWRRWPERQALHARLRTWAAAEHRLTGHTLKEKWLDGRLIYG